MSGKDPDATKRFCSLHLQRTHHTGVRSPYVPAPICFLLGFHVYPIILQINTLFSFSLYKQKKALHQMNYVKQNNNIIFLLYLLVSCNVFKSSVSKRIGYFLIIVIAGWYARLVSFKRPFPHNCHFLDISWILASSR